MPNLKSRLSFHKIAVFVVYPLDVGRKRTASWPPVQVTQKLGDLCLFTLGFSLDLDDARVTMVRFCRRCCKCRTWSNVIAYLAFLGVAHPTGQFVRRGMLPREIAVWTVKSASNAPTPRRHTHRKPTPNEGGLLAIEGIIFGIWQTFWVVISGLVRTLDGARD